MENDDLSDVEELLDEMEATLSTNVAIKPKLTKPLTQKPIKRK